MKKLRVQGMIFVCALAFSIAGCKSTFQDYEKKIVIAPDVMNRFLADKPKPVHRLYRNVLEQGERNIVLNHMRAGLASMELNELDAAEASFDLAVNRIDTIYADNEKAEEARSKFTKENVKDFKGESYERAMAFYYRGLLHLMRGDYGNAQASFGSGLLQDTYAEDKKYSQDFASLAFLRGWAYRCQASESAAVASFKEAFKLHKEQLGHEKSPTNIEFSDLKEPASDHNVLLIGETGRAPRKMAAGPYKEKLTYRRGPDQKIIGVVFRSLDTEFTARPFEDIFWQAHTRGGRAVDFIMEGKAEFKDATDTVGNVLITAGAATALYGGYGNNNNAAIAGGIMMLGGLIAKGIADATRPEADLRQWDNLPEHILLTTAKIDPEIKTVSIMSVGKDDKRMSLKNDTVKIFRAGRCGIAWTRTDSALAIPDQAPESGAPGYIIEEPKTDSSTDEETTS